MPARTIVVACSHCRDVAACTTDPDAAHCNNPFAIAKERARLQRSADILADFAVANSTCRVSGTEMNDLRDHVHGRPTSGLLMRPR